jgi:hypothetical protein
MSDTETDLLRASIDRLTQDERPPAGLAGRAFRRHRQRTIALRAAAAGTAVIAAGVLATAALPGAAPRPGQQDRPASASGTAQNSTAQNSTAQTPAALTAAYVSSHTERALAAAQRANLVEEIHTVGQNYPLGLTQVLSFPIDGGGTGHLVKQAGPTAAQENTWSYRGQLREQGLDPAGKPLFDATSTTARSPAGSRTVMNVSGTGADYPSRTWWRSSLRLSLPAAGQATCASAFLPPPVGTTLDWAAAIRTALSCGHFQLAGHEQLGGVNAIKLVSTKVNGPYTATAWVDPSTYLPVRVTWNWLDPRAQGPGTLTGDFRWVQPTQANLGALRVTIPDGFKQVQAGGLPVPGINL